MANTPRNDQIRYIELGNYVIDFNNHDVFLLDLVKDISPLYPLQPATTLIAACYAGSQKMTANGHTIEITAGEVFISPPNMKVSVGEHTDDFECRVMCITDNLVNGLLRDKIDLWHHAVYVKEQNIVNMSQTCEEELQHYLSLIRSKLKRNNPSAPFEIMLSLLRTMLLELCFALVSSDEIIHEQKLSQGKILFNRFLNIISNSPIKRQPISTYANMLAITPKYLTMLCLKYSNKTASDWVVQYTIEEIRFFLKSTDLSIKEVSARMGFSNMSHFGSYVRKHLGFSPSEYRYSKKN